MTRGDTPTSNSGDQAWFWTPEWQAGERLADAEIAAGADTFYDNGEEMLAALQTTDGTGRTERPEETP
jgi:antitoxin PrlF